MRYSLESTLPLRAFSPRLKGPFGHGMTLEGGGGGDVVSDVVSVVVPVVAVAASVVGGPEIGAAILGYADSIEAVAAGYSVSTLSAVGAASVGAASGALTEAQKTGDPGKILEAAGIGAAASGLGSEVGSTVGAATESPIAAGAASGATSGFTGAQLSGTNLEKSLRSGEIGGATGAVSAGLSEAAGSAGVPKDISAPVLAAAGPYIRQDVSSLFGGTTPSAPAGAPTQSAAPGQGLPSYLASGGGGSVLGSALTSGSSDISPPVQVGSEPSTSRSVWNQASLRSTDESGGAA